MYKNIHECAAILLAGGSGQRFHGQKQFVSFMGKPLWRHTYDKLCSILMKENIICVGIDVSGGTTRTHSVINGMEALAKKSIKRVLIVEAARPLVTLEQLRLLVNDEHQSTSFVMPLVNTVVMRNGNYLNRDELYELLTPQAFDYKMLLDALRSGRFNDLTDDTRIMYEYYGIKPFFIPTTENLIKVTYQRDLPIIESIYKNMKED